MDEEKYHELRELYHDVYIDIDDEINDISVNHFREMLLTRGMLPECVDGYIARYREGNQTCYIKDFGPQSLHEEIQNIRPTTPNLHLIRTRDRPAFNNEPDVQIQIYTNHHTSNLYTIEWITPDYPFFDLDVEDDIIPTVNASTEDHQLPPDTVLTVSTSNATYLVFPKGMLHLGFRKLPFIFVWILELAEYGLLMDFSHPYHYECRPDQLEAQASPPSRRFRTLPNSDVAFSLAKLAGLDLDRARECTLAPLESSGFSVYPAGRFNGRIEPLQEDLTVVVGRSPVPA